MAESNANSFEDGYLLKFGADLSDVRKALEAFKQEMASQPLAIQVRAAGTGGASSGATGAGGAVGLFGSEPIAMVREDQRREQRLLAAGASSDRVERLIDRSDSSTAIQVVARRRDNAPPFAPSTWGNVAGWGGGAGAPPWMPYGNGGPMMPAPGGVGGGGWTWGGGGAPPGGGGPPMGPGGQINIPNAPPVPQPATPAPPPWMRFSAGGLSRYFTAGFAFSEVGRLGAASQQYSTDTTLAGSDQAKQYEAEQRLQANITSTPIVGRFAGVVAEALTGDGQAGEVAMRGASANDAYTRAMLSGARLRKSIYYDSAEATAPSEYERRKVQIAAKYDPLIEHQAADRQAVEIKAAADKRDADLASIRTKYGTNNPDELRGGNETDAEYQADQRIRDAMRGEIAGVNKGYGTTESNIIARYTASAALRTAARTAEDDQNERDRDAALFGLRGQTASSRLTAGGFADAASLASLDARHDEALARVNPGDQNRGTVVAAQQAERDARVENLTRGAFLRGSEYDAAAAAGLAESRGDLFGGRLGQLNLEFQRTIVNAQTQDLPKAFVAAGMGWIGGIASLRREAAARSTSSSADVEISGYEAIGDRFGGSRASIRADLARRLNQLGTDAEYADARTTAANREAGVDRAARLYGARLRDNVDVTDALAQGSEAGGLHRTARVRELFHDSTEAADAEPDPGRRGDLLRAGINRLRAFERDLSRPGGQGVEVAPGTLGPGFSGGAGEQDAMQALREATEALKDLTRKLGSTGESFSPGTSSGGEF